jgi:hypothetical protein
VNWARAANSAANKLILPVAELLDNPQLRALLQNSGLVNKPYTIKVS